MRTEPSDFTESWGLLPSQAFDCFQYILFTNTFFLPIPSFYIPVTSLSANAKFSRELSWFHSHASVYDTSYEK